VLLEHHQTSPVPSAVPVGYRNVLTQPQVVVLDVDGRAIEVAVVFAGRQAEVAVGDGEAFTFVDIDEDEFVALVGLDLVAVTVTSLGRERFRATSATDLVDVTVLPRFSPPRVALAAGSLQAPMPGTVVRIDVAVGDVVAQDDALLALEAMKMEHTIRAPFAGTVTAVPVTVGHQVTAGDPLVVVEADHD
jgi:propionyl-CoA carboxylase alpha chain